MHVIPPSAKSGIRLLGAAPDGDGRALQHAVFLPSGDGLLTCVEKSLTLWRTETLDAVCTLKLPPAHDASLKLRTCAATVDSSVAIGAGDDGADEANSQLHLIKGGGAALTREKIVAAASKQFICIADVSKRVAVLGAFPLPVEVIPMARSHVARELHALGGQPVWREGVITDNQNLILDVHGMAVEDALEMEARINQITGVVCVGLFAARPADILLLGAPSGVERMLPPSQ